MRSIVFLAFLAVAFTATTAAPHVGNSVAVVAKGEKSLIGDIIGAIVGVDVDAVIAQTETTVNGLVRVGSQAAVELEGILVTSGTELISQAQAIIEDALARIDAILAPIIKLINQIISLIPGTKSQKDIIGDIIEALINSLINKFKKAIEDLEQVVTDTVNSLVQLANQGGQETVSAVNELAGRVLRDAAAEIQPLLTLLEPILEPTPIDDVINDLIEAIVGLDVKAIIKQIDATITSLDALLNSSANELNDILVANGITVQAELQAIVNVAIAEANIILKPIINLIELILAILGRTKTIAPQDLIGSILEQLFGQIEDLVAQLEQLVTDTVNRLVAVAANHGAITAGEIDALAQRTVEEARALIEPLLTLLRPILPPSKRI